jgi:hypothetical protein
MPRFEVRAGCRTWNTPPARIRVRLSHSVVTDLRPRSPLPAFWPIERKTRLTALRTPSLPPPAELGCCLKAKRDHVMLALLVGCALCRNELAELEIETIQQQERKMGPDRPRGQGQAQL